ncbi:VWA domain-containing protein [Streptomyces pathocidini]|uniref:VWA domain-containing protein n=1 Tax=Streptomyces pathocidini TaxID=1650571 RepID=A0ABW7USL6_9ACTN|nr:VWA domain-containing protein [Streptomyces pathocidini]
MGIRSLLRNVFGRSRADRPEPTVPEARTPTAGPDTPGTATTAAPAADTGPTDHAASAEPLAADAESDSLLAPFDEARRASSSAGQGHSKAEQLDAAQESEQRPGTPPHAEDSGSAEPNPETGTDKNADHTRNDRTTAADSARDDRTPTAETPMAEPPAAETLAGETSAAEPPAVGDTAEVPPAAPAVPAQATSEAAAPEAKDDTAEAEPSDGDSCPELAVPAQAKATAEHPATTVPPQASAAERDAAEREPVEQGTAEPATAEPATASTPAIPSQPERTPAEPSPAEAETTEPAAGVPAGLVGLHKAAGAALRRRGLGGERVGVYLVLDRSGSMRRYYKDGTVQHLAEQALALSANLDDAATVPVVFFSTDIDGTADLTLGAYEGRVEALHADLGHMGRTNYHRAVEAVVEHYEKSRADGAHAPALVLFQTDGAPTSRPAAEKALCEAAKLPIFWQFIGFGDPEAKGFDFLRRLGELAVPEKRAVDNAGFFPAGTDPLELSDDELYEGLTAEFPRWLAAAREAGIVA